MKSSDNAKQFAGECNNLFARLERGDTQSEALIREGAGHDTDRIREAATLFIDKLPLSEARILHRKLLGDPNEDVRFYAILCVNDLCKQSDADWLKEIAVKEKNKRNRDILEEKISGLE